MTIMIIMEYLKREKLRSALLSATWQSCECRYKYEYDCKLFYPWPFALIARAKLSSYKTANKADCAECKHIYRNPSSKEWKWTRIKSKLYVYVRRKFYMYYVDVFIHTAHRKIVTATLPAKRYKYFIARKLRNVITSSQSILQYIFMCFITFQMLLYYILTRICNFQEYVSELIFTQKN